MKSKPNFCIYNNILWAAFDLRKIRNLIANHDHPESSLKHNITMTDNVLRGEDGVAHKKYSISMGNHWILIQRYYNQNVEVVYEVGDSNEKSVDLFKKIVF
jgi:hypothetical protein